MRPPKPFPLHLALTVAALALGIFIGRRIGMLDIEPGMWRIVKHPAFLSSMMMTAAIITATSLKKKIKVSFTTLLVSCFFLGTVLIRLSDIAHPQQTQNPYYAYNQEEVSALSKYTQEKRSALADIYSEHGIHGDEKAVITAMTLGDRQGVSHDLKEAYYRSSAGHIFAISGLHMGIIFFFLAAILPRKRYPAITALLIVAMLWGYTTLVGFKASIMRASIMLSIYTLFPLIGRRVTAISTVLSTCFFMLLAAPEWLFDVGFQMSFLSVFCILLFFEHMYFPQWLPYYNIPLWRRYMYEDRCIRTYLTPRILLYNPMIWLCRWLYSITLLAVIAQGALAAPIIFYFHNFCPWFLLTDYIVSPSAIIIIPLALAILAMGYVEPYLPFLHYPITQLAGLLQYVTHWLNVSITWIASLPGNIY